MGFIVDVAEGIGDVLEGGVEFVGDVVGGAFDAVTGKTAANAAIEAAEIQAAAGQEAIGQQQESKVEAQQFLQPFEQLGTQGLEQANFLTDPQAQFDFLQNNPLFKLALENANRETKNLAASRGRVSAGDTLQNLSNNVLLSASPLIDRQRQSIQNLLNAGIGVGTSQANTAIGAGSNISNLLTDIGAVNAGGVVGAANAETAGFNNLVQLGTLAFGGGGGGGGRPPGGTSGVGPQAFGGA